MAYILKYNPADINIANNFIWIFEYTLGLKYYVLIADKIEENSALFTSNEDKKNTNIKKVLSVATNIRSIATEITTVRQ